MFTLKLVVAVTVTLSVGGAEGWFMEQDKGRELDGSLRCYQCDTNSKRPEDKSSAALCRSTHLGLSLINCQYKRNKIPKN